MRLVARLFIAALSLLIATGAPAEAPEYSQSYVILIKGAVAGNETVTERTDGRDRLLSSSEHEIFVTDGLETKRMAFTTKMVVSKSTWTPISYACDYTTGGTGDSYEVVIDNNEITRTLKRGGQISTMTALFQPNTVILDFSVYHQYEYVIRRYDFKKGGRQMFADFVPVVGSDIPLALTFLGSEKPQLKKGKLSLRNFSIDFVGIWSGTVSVDEDGRLVRLSIPAQDLEVVRKDLLVSENNQN